MSTKYKVSFKHVQAVLESFYYIAHDHDHYIHFKDLCLVQARMQQLETVNIRKSTLVEYAVQDVLSRIIHESLLQGRQKLELSEQLSQHPETRSEAIRAIRCDTKSSSPALIGWSLLYHIYIRADLAINFEMYAGFWNVHGRTLQRYKKQAIHMLLHRIIELEEQHNSYAPASN